MFHKLSVLGSQRAIWIFLAVLLGVTVRLTGMFADRLDVDIYYMMADTNKPFSDYTRDGGFGRMLMTYWWVIARSLGESLTAHRLIPLVLNIVAIILVAIWSHRYLNTPRYSGALATAFFGLNSWATYTVDYPVIGYSAEVLLGVMIFALAFRTCNLDVAFEIKGALLLVFILIFLGAFSSYTIVIPVCACLATSIIWNNRSLPSSYKHLPRMGSVFQLWPIMVVPLIQGLLWLLIPYRYLGGNMQTHMFQYFFNRSGYPLSATGAAQFAFHGTRVWIKGLVAPSGADELFEVLPFSQKLLYGVAIVAVVCTIIVLAKIKRMEKPLAIATIYVTLVASAILFGGLISKFPYGTARYTGWLLMPVAIIFGSVVGAWLEFVEKTMSNVKAKALISFAVITPCLLMVVAHAKETLTRRNTNHAVVETVKDPLKYNRVLYSGFVAPALRILASETASKGIDLGFGKVHKSVSEKILDPNAFAEFEIKSKTMEKSTVAVCAQSKERFAELHPSWFEVMASNYSLQEEKISPDLWVGVYSK
jgi:hypothetical protein